MLLNEDSQVEEMIAEAQEQLAKEFDWVHEVVDDQDWVRLTQSQFDPIEVTPNLYIVPSWHSLPKPDAVGIVLDPGLAFGTGSHPTTFMCLEYLAGCASKTSRILDYGCGSGILAITAKNSALV